MTTLQYRTQSGGRSSIEVVRSEDGRIILRLRRDGQEPMQINIRQDQARDLAKLLNTAADDGGAA